MFASIGAFFDRFWPHLIAAAGSVLLALFGTIWQGAGDVIGSDLATTFVVAAAILSVGGTIAAGVRYEKRTTSVQSEMLTGVRATLIPLATRFIGLAHSLDESAFVEACTELAMHCRAFAQRPGATSDANFYRLESVNVLSRINRAHGDARLRFERTRGKSPEAKEAKAVLDRLIAKETTFCRDVQDAEAQRTFCLAPGPRKYRCFISVPVVNSAEEVVGMLSLNSSRKQGLSDVDVSFLEGVAKLIAALDEVRVTSIRRLDTV